MDRSSKLFPMYFQDLLNLVHYKLKLTSIKWRKACLSGIIVVALIKLVLEVRQAGVIYKRSKFEAVT